MVRGTNREHGRLSHFEFGLIAPTAAQAATMAGRTLARGSQSGTAAPTRSAVDHPGRTAPDPGRTRVSPSKGPESGRLELTRRRTRACSGSLFPLAPYAPGRPASDIGQDCPGRARAAEFWLGRIAETSISTQKRYSSTWPGNTRDFGALPRPVKVGHPGRANKAVPAGWIRRIVDARFAMQ